MGWCRLRLRKESVVLLRIIVGIDNVVEVMMWLVKLGKRCWVIMCLGFVFIKIVVLVYFFLCNDRSLDCIVLVRFG